MTEHRQFLVEKEQIDDFIAQGYQITYVQENLSGSFVEFDKEGDKQKLYILTAEGRKYFSTIIVSRQRGVKNANRT